MESKKSLKCTYHYCYKLIAPTYAAYSSCQTAVLYRRGTPQTRFVKNPIKLKDARLNWLNYYAYITYKILSLKLEI